MEIGIDKLSRITGIRSRTRKMDKLRGKHLTANVIKGVRPGAVVDSSSSRDFNQSWFFIFKYLIEVSKRGCWS